jgi:RNA polymerase sigma-70 factor (ECF subfamily)
MPDEAPSVGTALARYSAYLEALAAIQVSPRLRAKFGASDVIQETLMEALRDRDRLRAMGEPERLRYLRKMLLNNLRDQIALFTAQARDVDRERQLAEEADASSVRVGQWLAREETPPLERMERCERAERLLEALAELPERERQAVVLQRFHGWKLQEIADQLGCTIGAIAGLQARGLRRLRELLPDLE